MKKLTLQDYIDLEQFIKDNKSIAEQQAFLLSRYYKLSLDHIKKIDIKKFSLMSEKMEAYITEKDIEIPVNKKYIKKKENKNKIENRFDILDLEL